MCLAHISLGTRLLLSEVCFLVCFCLGGREIKEEAVLEHQGEQSAPPQRAEGIPSRPDGHALPLSHRAASISGTRVSKAAGKKKKKTLFFSRADETPSASQKPCQRPHPLASNGPRSPSRLPATPAEAPPARSMLGVEVPGTS